MMMGAIMNKCIHSVFIPERFGDVNYSDGCSICQTLFPKLDYHYGLVIDVTASPRTMMGAYELWKSNKSTFTYEKLFFVVRRFVRLIARSRLGLIGGIPSWDDLVEDIASDCLIKINSYDINKSAFSTWLKECTNHAITNWLDREVGWDEDSIDDPEHPVDVIDRRSGLDEKIFSREVRSKLDENELKLFEMMAEDRSWREIGDVLEVSHVTAYRLGMALKAKIYEMGETTGRSLNHPT